jgi:chromosome segregation ATPase
MANTYVMDGKEYVEVERKANVGDKVIVLNSAHVDSHNIGRVYTVKGFDGELIDTDGFYADGSELNLQEDEYYVLEPTNSEECCEASPQITDLLANLARRVEYLERKATSLEQQLRDTQGNVEKLAEELATVKHQSAPKEVEVVTFEKFLDSIADKVAERLVGGGAR